MCFSANASFVTAAALTPLGLLCLPLARRLEARRWMPLALLPLLFASQQALEGFVWLGLGQGVSLEALRPTALAYLAFAYAFWPIWIPWCALRLGSGRLVLWKQRLICGLLALGALLGTGLWLPLLYQPALVHPIVRHGSIDYRAQPSWAVAFGHPFLSLLYALIVIVPLLLQPSRRLRWLGVSLTAAFVLAQLAFLYAFSSVWCYFSAVLSGIVLWVLRAEQTSGSDAQVALRCGHGGCDEAKVDVSGP